MTRDMELMARIASLYYLEDHSQAEIAERFGISRIKVGRLLKRARETGVVEVRINTPSALSLDLENELKQQFGLKQALLVATQESDDVQRQLLGQMTAAYLTPQIHAQTVVAVGMGRNVAAVASAVPKSAPISCTFVGAIGGSSDVGVGLNSGDICRQFAEVFGGRSEVLYAPAYARSKALRDSFFSHEDVRHILHQAAQAPLAIVGIGDASQESAVVQMGCFAPPDMDTMRNSGAVGDILGFFFDIAGNGLSPGMGDRVVSLGQAQLRQIPGVIGIASEEGKTQALLGALRTGILDVLATSVSNAGKILDLACQT